MRTYLVVLSERIKRHVTVTDFPRKLEGVRSNCSDQSVQNYSIIIILECPIIRANLQFPISWPVSVGFVDRKESHSSGYRRRSVTNWSGVSLAAVKLMRSTPRAGHIYTSCIYLSRRHK